MKVKQLPNWLLSCLFFFIAIGVGIYVAGVLSYEIDKKTKKSFLSKFIKHPYYTIKEMITK
jgi:hypothetical protein